MIDIDAEIEMLRQRIWKLRAERQTMLDNKDLECKRKDALLRRALAVIRWHAFGECRTPGVDDLPTASEIEIEIITELGGDMSILTQAEICTHVIRMPEEREITNAELETFARAIEAAVIAKLAAGVRVVPEQVAARWPSVPGSHHYAGAGKCPPNSFGPDAEDLFTRNQLQTAIAAARVQAAVLAKQATAKPRGYLTETDMGDMVWTPADYLEACTYCDDNEVPIPLYALTGGASPDPSERV